VLFACVAVITLHVAIGTHPPNGAMPSATKDALFISSTYREFLKHERPLSPGVVLAAAHDYARFMAADHAGRVRVAPTGSRPLERPFTSRPILYQRDSGGTRTASVEHIGNAVGWAIGFVAVVSSVGFMTRRRRQPLIAMLLIVYASFIALHLYLDGLRVVYLYHYFPALLLSFCLVPLAIQELASGWRAISLRTRRSSATDTSRPAAAPRTEIPGDSASPENARFPGRTRRA